MVVLLLYLNEPQKHVMTAGHVSTAQIESKIANLVRIFPAGLVLSSIQNKAVLATRVTEERTEALVHLVRRAHRNPPTVVPVYLVRQGSTLIRRG